MRIRKEACLIAALVCAITAEGCTLFTGPDSHPVTIAVTTDTIAAIVNHSPTTAWLQFKIPVTMHNGHSAPVSDDICAVTLEEPSGTDWKTVWQPDCSLVDYAAPPTIAPGETKTYQWAVSAAISGSGWPKWGGEQLDGIYRVSIRISPTEKLSSNSFAISSLATSR